MPEEIDVEGRLNRGGRRVDLDLGMTMIPLAIVAVSDISTQLFDGLESIGVLECGALAPDH